jgi:peptide/nickel transport system permease protein
VLGARAVGVSDTKLVFREILPNTLPPVIAMVALLASSGILTEASLSFLTWSAWAKC